MIPTIISQIAAGKLQIQLGDLAPTRDFNYVLDTCLGHYKSWSPLKASEKPLILALIKKYL